MEQTFVPDSAEGLGYVTETFSYLSTAVYGLTKGVINMKELISCRITLYKARLKWTYHFMWYDIVVKVYVYAAFHDFAYRTRGIYVCSYSGGTFHLFYKTKIDLNLLFPHIPVRRFPVSAAHLYYYPTKQPERPQKLSSYVLHRIYTS